MDIICLFFVLFGHAVCLWQLEIFFRKKIIEIIVLPDSIPFPSALHFPSVLPLRLLLDLQNHRLQHLLKINMRFFLETTLVYKTQTLKCVFFGCEFGGRVEVKKATWVLSPKFKDLLESLNIPWSPSRPNPTSRAKNFSRKIFALSVDWTVEFRNIFISFYTRRKARESKVNRDSKRHSVAKIGKNRAPGKLQITTIFSI